MEKRKRLKLNLKEKADRKAKDKEREAKSDAPCEVKRDLARYWTLEHLENCFSFVFGDMELYVEFAELTASGAAYEMKEPQNILQLLERLERAAPGFEGIHIPGEDIYLVRIRQEDGRGLLQEIDDVKKRFLSDLTLSTVNFYNFYFEYLKIDKDDETDNVRLFPQQLKKVENES